MKKIYQLLLASLVLLFITCQYSFSQFDSSIIGMYKVISGPSFTTFVIHEKEAEAKVGRIVKEKYFYLKTKENGNYIIQKVDPSVKSIQEGAKKDRTLLEVNIEKLEGKQLLLTVIHPNNRQQKIVVERIKDGSSIFNQ